MERDQTILLYPLCPKPPKEISPTFAKVCPVLKECQNRKQQWFQSRQKDTRLNGLNLINLIKSVVVASLIVQTVLNINLFTLA